MDATAATPTQASSAESRWPVRLTLVLAFAGLLFCARLSERALWSEEVRWAQIPREMQASGNYLWPTINGRTYYDKPLGSYWLVLLASLFTGGVDETSARLPSALAGLAAVAFAMLIARRLYDDDTATWTGVILATSFSFVFFARNASTDVETIAGVLAALWIFLRKEAHPPGWWILLLWLVMALTSLTKGLLGFVLPIMIIGLYSTFALGSLPRSFRALVERNQCMFNRWSLIAIPLGVFVYLGPFLLSIAAGGGVDGLEMVYRENIRRFFDPVNHRGPVYLYGWAIFMLLAPWSLLLPAALVHAHAGENKTERGRLFALAYFWGTFAFFTLSSSRRSYYLLPILPAAALLIARLLAARASLGKTTHVLLAIGFGAAVLMLAGIGILVPAAAWILPRPLDQVAVLPFMVLWMICLPGFVIALADFRPRSIGIALAMAAFSGMTYYFLIALPATESLRTQRPFADSVRQTIADDTHRLALYNTRDVVYYLDIPLPVAECHNDAELQFAMEHSIRWVILRRRDWNRLKIEGTVLIEETIQPWEDRANKLLLVEVGR